MPRPELIIPVTFFLTAAAVIIVGIIARHRERMIMMEKGMTSEEIRSMNAKDIRRDPLSSLKWGIVISMIGFAAFLGMILHQYFYVEESIIIGLLSLFVGVGLIIFYLIAAKKMNQ